MIGALGDVVFIATASTLRTFQEFARKTAARWAKHDRIGLKPVSQFIGPDLDTITFTMRFDVRFGIDPRKELEALLDLSRTGKALDLTIGGKSLGEGLWVITSVEQSWDAVDNRGNVLVGSASVSLEEYIEG